METSDDELMQRLDTVEIEQYRQDYLLDCVSELKAQIQQLEATLGYRSKQTISHQSQTQHKISHISTHGYVICLMLNPKSPPEWSGKEWHAPGKGKCYLSLEQACQCLQQLKELWPDYPIEILKKSL